MDENAGQKNSPAYRLAALDTDFLLGASNLGKWSAFGHRGLRYSQTPTLRKARRSAYSPDRQVQECSA
jgi:hypothetical protein